jgi:putative ABC transport system permease protein
MRLYFGPSNSSNWLVLSPAQTTRVNFIPVLASPTFLEMTGIKVGDKFAAYIGGVSLMLDVKNAVNYFPTMYDLVDNGYLILSRDALLVELNKSSRIPVNPNEIWLRVDEKQPTLDFREVIPQVKRLWEVETQRILFKSDPLTLGLRSVIYLAYSLTLLLSLIGFATIMYLSARKRISHYGILRSLGLSTLQLYGSLVLEQLILLFSGLSLGIILGSLLNKIILPGLPISYAGVPAIPPFQAQEDWYAVIRLITVVASGFLITLAFGTYMLWRIKLHQALRIGEE